MHASKMITAVLVVFCAALLYAQTEQQQNQPDAQQQQQTESVTLPQSYENVSLNEIDKKEKDIGNLVDQLNEKNKQITTSGSNKTKKALQVEVDTSKQQLQQEMKEYALMVNSYNKRLSKELPSAVSTASSTTMITEAELRTRQTELLELVNQINKKISDLNAETNETVKTTLAGEIEALQAEFTARKVRYLKLVNEYNSQMESKMNLLGT